MLVFIRNLSQSDLTITLQLAQFANQALQKLITGLKFSHQGVTEHVLKAVCAAASFCMSSKASLSVTALPSTSNAGISLRSANGIPFGIDGICISARSAILAVATRTRPAPEPP